VAYAYQCLLGWIRSGLIILRCRERGIPLPTGFVMSLSEDEAEQLTEEILAEAVLGFQEPLRQGRWSPEGGASLAFVEHYNRHRPHRALQLEAPDRPDRLTVVGEGQEGGVLRRDLLGGLLHEYRRAT
jgi:hypothetical protein